MQVIAGLDPRLPLADLGAYSARVEGLGYNALHLPEMINDPYVMAALAVDATSDLRVRTGVALAFVRSPMATAIAAWGLAHQSGGRFDVGLGTQIRPNVERRYGAAFDRPVARMAATVEAVRACFDSFESGDAPAIDNDFVRINLLQPEFRPAPLGPVRRPEIWLGAVGDQMVRLAGRCSDGLLTHPTNSLPADLESRLLPTLQQAATAARRATPPVVAAPMVATGPDLEAVATAIEPIRRRLAFLYSTPAYAPTLELLGFESVGSALRDLIRSSAWDQLPMVLPDALLHEVVPSAPWSDLPGVLAERFGALYGVSLRPPTSADDDVAFAAVVAELRAL